VRLHVAADALKSASTKAPAMTFSILPAPLHGVVFNIFASA